MNSPATFFYSSNLAPTPRHNPSGIALPAGLSYIDIEDEANKPACRTTKQLLLHIPSILFSAYCYCSYFPDLLNFDGKVTEKSVNKGKSNKIIIDEKMQK